MTTRQFVTAAQYLRVSTENQQYSLANQADTIRQYASAHGFEIVRTYSDAAKSGLRLKNRDGLKQLLKDVVGGAHGFQVVLVYDVSRWGRFQDSDESAHYEYLCKSSGVPVHYCAEQFPNDNSIPGLILKALKRTMAGEYSRELSVKVKAGQFRLAKLGFKMGGHTPFGLRRQLVDVNGHPKQILVYGERKSIANDRVVLVPGPPEEVATVERIFREFVDQHKSLKAIARGLNQDGIHFVTGSKWDVCTVTNVLKNSKYIGIQTWGRTTAFLSGPTQNVPQDQWAICPNAFKPIISPELFRRAQSAFGNLTCNLTNEQMLQRLKPLLARHGKLTSRIIDKSRSCPGTTTYYYRFGGLLSAYRSLGLSTPQLCNRISLRQRRILLRQSLVDDFVAALPGGLEIVRRNSRSRALLHCKRTGVVIDVILAYQYRGGERSWWRIDGRHGESSKPVILAFPDAHNLAIESLWVFPQLCCARFRIQDPRAEVWWKSGEKLEAMQALMETLERVGANWKAST